MRIAYADPPYSGMASRYGEREVRQDRLLRALLRFDGFAMSCTTNTLLDLAPIVQGEKLRVAAWCKTWSAANFAYPMYAWEPVIFRPSRGKHKSSGIRRDWVACAPMMNGFFGAKPPEFSGWLFDNLLAAHPDDEFHDFFYGSGMVTKAWNQWRSSAPPPLFQKASGGPS